jgi:D-amino peptidase
MIAPLDETYDALILIGFHGKRGTAQAILDHTLTAKLHWVRINGREYGESGLAVAHAGHFGVPLAFASGDDKLAAEIRQLVPEAQSVVVKNTLGRTSAMCLSPANARGKIRKGVARALAGKVKAAPLRLPTPLKMEVELFDSGAVDQAICLTNVTRVGGRTIACEFDDMPSLSKFLSLLIRIIRIG